MDTPNLIDSQQETDNPTFMNSIAKDNNYANKIIFKVTVIDIHDGQIELMGEDFQEFSMPQLYVPGYLKVGDFLEITVKRNFEQQQNHQQQFEDIQSQIFADHLREINSNRMMKNNEF